MSRRKHADNRAANIPTIATRMAEVERRLDSLDNAIQEVHPDYAGPVVERLGHLEETVRSHANKTFEIFKKYSAHVEDLARRTTKEAEDALARLAAAADRHQTQGAFLRQQWGGIKEDIDARSAQIEQDMVQMKAMLVDAMSHLQKQDALVAAGDIQIARLAKLESLANQVEATLRSKLDFKTEQAKLVAKAVCRAESMPAVLKEAQSCSASRSPSAAAIAEHFNFVMKI